MKRSFWPGTLLGALQAALLRLQNEAVLPVEVDPPLRIAFVAVLLDRAFEDVIVVFVGSIGGIRRREPKERNQFIEKRDVVRPLLAALATLPTPDKGFNGFGVFGFPHRCNLAGGGAWIQPREGRQLTVFWLERRGSAKPKAQSKS